MTTTPADLSTDLPALRAAVLARVTRHLNTLTEDDLRAAIIQPTDKRMVEALAGATPPKTISEALRSLPTSDPYAILGDIVRTGGGVEPMADDEAEYNFSITLSDGSKVAPKCLVNDSGLTPWWVDSLWGAARAEGWTPIYFFHWITSPNPRLPLDATPRRFLEANRYSQKAIEATRTALRNFGEMGG